ncbi:MAG TPA: polysaccharide biosynthesis tyrosine autokinase, partial [Pyrinomonadaceae bacterium]|nr:polysaccharide biosynthesis tyrosine autokinase [Pyrinomonadaceae bacterium]
MKQSNQLVPKRKAETSELDSHAEPVSSAISSYYGVENGAEDEFKLREYLRAVRKRLWMVVGVCLLSTMLAAVYIARKPDVFEAQARVQVDLENNPALGSGTKGGPVILNSASNDPVYFNTQLQILSGPGLLRRVVKTLDLEHNQAFLQPQAAQKRSTWQRLLGMFGLGGRERAEAAESAQNEVPLTTTIAPASSHDDLVEAKKLAPFVSSLQGGLKIEPVKETRTTGFYKDTRLIDIRFTHQDPQTAARIVNAIADTFVLSNLEKKTESNSSAGDFLQKRVAELQAQIRSAEERLAAYARSNQILSLDPTQNTVVERLTGLNRQLLEAQNDLKLAEAAYHAALAPGAANALAESDAHKIREIETKLTSLRQARGQLLVEATEEAPEVKEVTEQIGVLEKELKAAREGAARTVVTNLETKYRQAQAREQSLRNAFNRQKGETVTQNEAAINYRIIQQEIETNKVLLDGLLQRSKENDVVLAGTPNNISVLDYALVPEAPVGPARMRTVLLALMLSLGAGLGLAVFLEYLDDTLHTSEEVESQLRLPALAAIPAAGLMKQHKKSLPSSKALQLRNAGESPELLINADARSPLAETYRHLRTSVLLSTAGRAPKTLLVTSSLPGEGKTTTAVNTAISLAQTGARVLMIDADMRRPRLHSIFGLRNRYGLSTILSSEMTDDDILDAIEADEATNLHVLPSGPVPPNPAELIGSEQMRRLLAATASAYTHVVIDSPPVSSFTDGVLVSTLVDGVLLVVHGGKTSRQVAR